MWVTNSRAYGLLVCATFMLTGKFVGEAFPANVSDGPRSLVPEKNSGDKGFGQSVAISGNTVVVGAPKSNVVYLFNARTGEMLFKISTEQPRTPAVGQSVLSTIEGIASFGCSVAISGKTAIVGTDGGSGAAFLFDVASKKLRRLSSEPRSEDILTNTTPLSFGRAVAIDGRSAIVGATDGRVDERGLPIGSAYLFDVETGEPRHVLFAPDSTAIDYFGESVAIEGNCAIVGAPGRQSRTGNSGSAYLFNVASGKFLRRLVPTDGSDYSQLGCSVAVSKNIVIVGAVGKEEPGVRARLSGTGAAYLFDIVTGRQLGRLTASDGRDGDGFGRSVAIRGRTAIVGANQYDAQGGLFANRSAAGWAYVFDVATGNEMAILTAADANNSTGFGGSVAIGSSTAVVGACCDGDDDAGVSYLFNSRNP